LLATKPFFWHTSLVDIKKLALPFALIVGALVLALVMLVSVQPSTYAEEQSSPGLAQPSNRTAARSLPETAKRFDAPTKQMPIAHASPFSESNADSPPPEVPWEIPINTILESPESNDQVALRLASLVPTLPPDGQVEAAQHMVNLLDDENYETALQMLLNPGMPTEVQEVIYSDILNRPNMVKLPALTALIGAPNHGLRDEALNTLQIFVGYDLGNNPLTWKSAVDEFLRQESLQDQVEAAPQ